MSLARRHDANIVAAEQDLQSRTGKQGKNMNSLLVVIFEAYFYRATDT
jgi:hypothetical protein